MLSGGNVMKNSRKRIELVKVKMVRESTVLYEPRQILCPLDSIRLIKNIIDDADREKFIVISLDTKNQPTHVEICSIGSLNSTIVHPREVFKSAIISNAATIILAHNHPSGKLQPSAEDKILTERLKEAGEIIGIRVLDHVIVGNTEEYYSFKEHNLI